MPAAWMPYLSQADLTTAGTWHMTKLTGLQCDSIVLSLLLRCSIMVQFLTRTFSSFSIGFQRFKYHHIYLYLLRFRTRGTQ